MEKSEIIEITQRVHSQRSSEFFALNIWSQQQGVVKDRINFFPSLGFYQVLKEKQKILDVHF